jgi:lipopolysaccharide/colanic/teichoic acid biosynthesis glycosyltransferase
VALTGLALAVLGIFAAALSRQLSNEFAAWTPWLTERLVQRAIRGLPSEYRDRFEEEWRSHINEIPGEVGKLIVVFGLPSAARRISSQLASGPEPVIADVIKRLLDFGVGAALLLFVLPVFIAAALLLWVDGQGPILCWEERTGLNGRTFPLLKFRSGTAKNERSRDEAITRRHLTAVEKIVRVLRWDELPQVINVLRGDMSFVGPRPERPEVVAELAKTIPHYDDRHAVRPGITGWAQINLLNIQSATDALSCDLYYIRNRRTSLDLAILGKTAWIVLKETLLRIIRRYRRRD